MEKSLDFERKFNEIYDEIIAPNIEKIEKARIKNLIFSVGTFIGLLCFASIVFIYLYYVKDWYLVEKSSIFLLCTGLGCAVILPLIPFLADSDYGKYVKKNFLKNVFNKFVECKYMKRSSLSMELNEKFLSYDVIKESRLFECTMREDDECFICRHNGIIYSISESIIQAGKKISFAGLILYVKTNKKILERIVVKWGEHRKYSVYALVAALFFGFFGLMFTAILEFYITNFFIIISILLFIVSFIIFYYRKKGKPLDLYEIIVNGFKTGKNSLITPSLLCILERYRKIIKPWQIGMVINKNGILIRLDSLHNFFELPTGALYRKMSGKKDLRKMLFEFYTITKFVHEILELEEIKKLFVEDET